MLAGAGTLGYLAGSIVGWLIGRSGGRPLVVKHGRSLHLSPSRLKQADRWFERWGPAAVLLGRIVPFVRSFISIPAGVFEMALLPYTALTLVGSAIWAFSLAGIGWALGSSYAHFDSGFKYAEYAIALIILLTFATPVITRLWRAQTHSTRD